MIREGTPLRLLAIVYDLGQEPCCRPEWVAASLSELLRIADERAIRSLSLTLLGVRHGRLPVGGFVELLKCALREGAHRHLRKIWLTVPEEKGDEVRSLLAQREKGAPGS